LSTPWSPARWCGRTLHEQNDEFSYVLEGEIGVRIGEQEFTTGPGSYVLKPRGIPHTFWNPTDRPARLLEIISPAGLEAFFRELGSMLAGPGEPDFAALAALPERYGIRGQRGVDSRPSVPYLRFFYGSL